MMLPDVLIILAMVILVGGPLLGLIFHRSDRARSVKAAESTKPETGDEQQAFTYHPRLIKRYRLDRHVAYVCLNAGLLMYGAGVILSPEPNSNLAELSYQMQQSLGLCLMVGSSMALTGSTLGARIGRRHRIMASISNNPLAPMLGDDIRLPYTMASAGLLAIGVSMGFYVTTLIGSAPSKVLGTLGGGVSVGVGMMCLILGPKLIWFIRDYNRARTRLLVEAHHRMSAD
jgi:hypothetical protein